MHGRTRRTRWRAIGLTAATLLTLTACSGGASGSGSQAGGADCDGYADRDISMVIGRTPGGGHDEYGRFLAPLMEEELGQTVVIENVDGAGGRVAVNQVLNADPDGYTIHLLEPNGLAALASVQEVDYDLADFTMLGAVNSRASTVAVSAESDIETLEDLVSASEDGALTFATAGLGSPNFVNGVIASDAAGIDFEPVPHEGSAEAIASVIRGDTDYTVFSNDAIAEHVETGELRALVQFSAEPIDALADVPSGADVDMAEFDDVLTTNLMLVAPPELPDCVQEKLTDAVQAALNSDEFAEFGADGRIVNPGPPEDAAELIEKAGATYDEYADVFREYLAD
jgi:tripartite-type tricarboxylate transporter receptor subunit TctC